MKRIVLSFFLLLIFIASYAQLTEINVFKTIKTCQNVNLSQIANKLSYVRLDDAKQTALVSRISLLTTNNSFISIYDRQVKKLFLFSAEGSFIKTLLGCGKGPNEFVDINSIDLSTNNQLLVLSNTTLIYVLDSNGIVSAKITLNRRTPLAKWITQDIIGLFYYYPYFLENNGYEITFIDRKGKVLNNSIPNKTKGVNFNDLAPKYSCGWNLDTLYYWTEYHDTVYSITKNMKVVPRVKLHNNEKRFSVESIKQKATMYDKFDADTHYFIDAYDESGDFIFMSGVYQLHHYCLVINRQTGIGRNIFDDYGKDHWIGLKNDLDGGFDFWPANFDQDKIMTMSIDPNELRETFTKHLKDMRPVKNVNVRDSVQKNVIERINLMDNPILMQIKK